MNIKFSYRYKGADNYQRSHSVIFSNNSHIPIGLIINRIHDRLREGIYFKAHHLNVEELNLGEAKDSQEHYWHEIESIRQTSEAHTSPHDISTLLN